MKKFFGYDGPIFSFLEKVASLLWLNILWIICCIPIITIGAATSSLYYVTLKMIKNEESYIAKSFFRAFKENFKQATIIWLVEIAGLFLLVIDNQFVNPATSNVLHIVLCAIEFIILIMGIYAFPLIAKFDNTTLNSMKNALLIGMINAPFTLLIVIIFAVPVALAYFIPALAPLSISIGISTVAYFSSIIFNKIFEKLISNENNEDSSDNI